MNARIRRAKSLTALLLAVGLTLAALAGCGSDGGDEDQGSAAPAPSDGATAATGAASSADEQEIRALFARMGKAIAARDAKAACPLMAKSAQRTFVMLAESGPKTCERGFAIAFKDGTNEARDPKLVRVEVQGPRALVYARTPTSEQLEQAPFVKEGDQWRVESWLTD